MSAHQLEQAVEMIARQTTRLQALIENFLAVVHITSGRMDLDREPVDLRDVVREMVAHCQLAHVGPEIVVDAQEDVGLWDRVRLDAVVGNLVSNAIKQARIFEKFERAVSERHYGGFGLGLWVVRQIVEAHGGSIHVASEAGQGSTFVVELPLSLQTVV
ncbi:MAG: hypothetical protein DMF89_06555 [Acidobacteria bacterium]|nr:MAG: hypothetical protein DMF89_06555 [Acidobacteriota bacterium]